MKAVVLVAIALSAALAGACEPTIRKPLHVRAVCGRVLADDAELASADVSLHPWGHNDVVAYHTTTDVSGQFNLAAVDKGHYSLTVRGNEKGASIELFVVGSSACKKEIEIVTAPIDCPFGTAKLRSRKLDRRRDSTR